MDSSTPRQFEFFKERKEIKEGYKFVFEKKEDAEYVVKHLGSHMGDITTCLLAIVEDKEASKGIRNKGGERGGGERRRGDRGKKETRRTMNTL